MNQALLFQINGWAGHYAMLDDIMIFCAQQLIYVVFLLAVLWAAMALHQREYSRLCLYGLNLAVTFALSVVISYFVIEARPFETYQVLQLVAHGPGQAFPSDHTIAASAIAFGFLFFTQCRKTGLALLVAALLIGFSRIYTGVHYPGDIAGAVLIALFSAWVINRSHHYLPIPVAAR